MLFIDGDDELRFESLDERVAVGKLVVCDASVGKAPIVGCCVTDDGLVGMESGESVTRVVFKEDVIFGLEPLNGSVTDE